MREQESRLAEAEARHDVAARKGRVRCEDMLTRYLGAANYIERRRIEEEEAARTEQEKAHEQETAHERKGVVRR